MLPALLALGGCGATSGVKPARAPETSAKPADAPPASKNEYLAKALEEAGGYPRYLRVETISYDFEEVRGTERAKGRQVFKFRDAAGPRAREERESSEGRTVTIVTSAGARVWLDGRPLTDPALVEQAGSRLMRDIFWLTAPHNIQESSAPVHYIGTGFFLGRLLSRLKVDLGRDNPFAGLGGLVLYLDKTSGRMQGAALEGGERGGSAFFQFAGFEPVKNLLTVATVRAEYNSLEERQGSFQIRNLALNGYMNEALFQGPDDGGVSK